MNNTILSSSMHFYQCVRCEKDFINKIDIERHLRKNERCESKWDNFIFSDSDVLQMSLIKKNQKEYFYNQSQSLEVDNEYGDKTVGCKYCFSFYKNKILLTKHTKICTFKEKTDELKILFNKLKEVKDGHLNSTRTKITDIINLEQDYTTNHISENQKMYLVLNQDLNLIIEKIFENKININVVPINNNMSGVIMNSTIKKINNDLMHNILILKCRVFFEKIVHDLIDKGHMNPELKSYLKRTFENVLNSSNKNNILQSIKKNISKREIFDFNYFGVSPVNFTRYNDIIHYFESNDINYTYQINDIIDENCYTCAGGKINYKLDGTLINNMLDNLWKDIDMMKK